MTTTPTTLYLVRHGETRWNASGLLQGASDIELNDVGLAQAAEVAPVLKSIGAVPLDFIVSSTLSRAARTADVIAETLGMTVSERLDSYIERSYGEAEGLTLADAGRRWPGPGLFPGQESEERVVARGRAALADVFERYRGRRIAVVTHGTVIRLLVASIRGVPGEDVPHVRNCSVTTVVADPEWSVADFNRVADSQRNENDSQA